VKKAKALIFDLDGTLFHSDMAYERSLNALGLSLENPRYAQARKQVKSALPPRHVVARNRLLYFKNLLMNERRYSPQAVLRLVERYEKNVAAELSRQWRALKRSALFASLGRRFPIVILTNENTRMQLIKLAAVDPGARFFKCLITSEELGVEKPDRRMFDAARRHLGVSYRDCVMIGDSMTDDINPAMRLGMQAVLTREFSSSPAPRGKVVVINKLDDLKAVLA
jgi:putative hydrolase of the HAD superfamily